MSTRFNRNNTNVPDDRLFPADFQVDQNAQDSDILQIAADFGCLPCIGSGLVVQNPNPTNHTVEVSIGWAYGTDGRRVTLEAAADVTLENYTTGEENNYIVISHKYVYDTTRPAHRTGTYYPTRMKDSFQFTVKTALETDDIVLANCKQLGTGEITILTDERISRSCKLVSEDKVPGVTKEGEDAGEPPKPGQQEQLPDLPVGRTIPMPIILSGTRNGSTWHGIETIMPENLGRTDAAMSALTLERVNLKSGTPLADLKVWIGDWGQGTPAGSSGDDRYICNFSMGTIASGVSAWTDDLWVNDPPGKYAYYLVSENESWYAPIDSSGSDWVQVKVETGNEIPGTGIYYICPYAEVYRSQAIPWETDTVLLETHPYTARHYNRLYSPTAPVVLIKDLNLGGKYKIKVASVISGDNYTKWAEQDFIVGQDLLVCWQPSATNLAVTPVDGGVEVTIPGISSGTTPETYEICYVYGSDPASLEEPDFDDSTHPTICTSERLVKLDVPPGKAVKVSARAILSRMVMRCGTLDKIIKQSGSHVTAGGVTLRRNRKAFTGLINEAELPTSSYELADQVPLPNAIWAEKVLLFNPTDTAQTDFTVWIHGSNQSYSGGRAVVIASGGGGDATSVPAREAVDVDITDFNITAPSMQITVENNSTAGPKDINLRYTIQYREDTNAEIS